MTPAMAAVSWQGAHLRDLDLSSLRLPAIDFRDSRLIGIKFNNCALKRARFDNATLIRSEFKNINASHWWLRVDSLSSDDAEAVMARHPGFFDAETRLEGLSTAGDPLVRLAAVVDFERFRGELETALERSDRAKGGRPPYDAVLMFKVLVLQTLYTLSDDAAEYQLKDRLSFMRFCGLALHDPVPDACAKRTLCV